jgi:LmbE family N-acetylglucosaminyl deacetylase
MTPAQAALLALLGAPEPQPGAGLPATMLVAAHPDDETVGAGSRLPRLAQARLVCVTDGAPRTGEDASRHGFTPPQYAQARRVELEAALALCGIASERLQSLDCPDQQASLQLAPLAERLAHLIAQCGSEVVLTQPYEGGHPDHDATAFVVHAAAALLRARGQQAPDLVEMGSYHRGADGVRTCGFLPLTAGGDDEAVVVKLTPDEQRFKSELLACFVTQRDTLRGFPVDVEAFRPAPRYEFRAPPHEGVLNYERYPWGMSGEGFRALAAQAMQHLGLEGPL